MSNQEADQPNRRIHITIDATRYELADDDATGATLIALVPVPEDRDLWLEVPGPKDDIAISSEKQYKVKNGSHFYTAPKTINPGRT